MQPMPSRYVFLSRHIPAPMPRLSDANLHSHTPPVFHPECHGITPAELKRLPSIPCSQHNCAECNRNTAQSGGMLFRCAPKTSLSLFRRPEWVSCLDVRRVLRRSVKTVCHRATSTLLVTSYLSCTCKRFTMCERYSCPHVCTAHCWDSVPRRRHIIYAVMTATPFGLRILPCGRGGRRRWQKRSKSSKQLQKRNEVNNNLMYFRLVLCFASFQYIDLPSTIHYALSLLHRPYLFFTFIRMYIC